MNISDVSSRMSVDQVNELSQMVGEDIVSWLNARAWSIGDISYDNIVEFVRTPIGKRRIINLSVDEIRKYLPDMEWVVGYDEAIDELYGSCEQLGLDIDSVDVDSYVHVYNERWMPFVVPEVKPRAKDSNDIIDDIVKMRNERVKTKVKMNKVIDELKERFKERDHVKKVKRDALNELVREVENRLQYKHFTDANYGSEFIDDVIDLSPSEQNKRYVQDYKEWKRNNSEDVQKSIVDEQYESLMNDPLNGVFSFEGLTNDGRRHAFPLLKEWLTDVVGGQVLEKKYKFCFKVNGQWYSKPLTPELYDEMMSKFSEESLLYSIDKTFKDYISDPAVYDLPEWSLFDAVSIKEVRKKGNNEVSGDFFPFVNRTCINLERYQIFDSIGVEGKQRKELNDCCFVYSLMGIVDDNVLNSMRLRINNRNLNQKDVRCLCEEFGIKAKIRLFK